MLYLIFSNLHFWHSNCIMVCNYDLFCLFFIIGPPSRVAFFLSQLFDDVKSKKKRLHLLQPVLNFLSLKDSLYYLSDNNLRLVVLLSYQIHHHVPQLQEHF